MLTPASLGDCPVSLHKNPAEPWGSSSHLLLTVKYIQMSHGQEATATHCSLRGHPEQGGQEHLQHPTSSSAQRTPASKSSYQATNNMRPVY